MPQLCVTKLTAVKSVQIIPRCLQCSHSNPCIIWCCLSVFAIFFNPFNWQHQDVSFVKCQCLLQLLAPNYASQSRQLDVVSSAKYPTTAAAVGAQKWITAQSATCQLICVQHKSWSVQHKTSSQWSSTARWLCCIVTPCSFMVFLIHTVPIKSNVCHSKMASSEHSKLSMKPKLKWKVCLCVTSGEVEYCRGANPCWLWWPLQIRGVWV